MTATPTIRPTNPIPPLGPTVPAARPPTRRRWLGHLSWLGVLVTGLALFCVVLVVLLNTGDPIYVPCLLLLGAAVVPVTLTTFVQQVERSRQISATRLLAGAVLGGVVGGVLAGQLEFDTAHALGSLPTPMIGLIEESAKLAIPALFLLWWRPRPRAVDGLVLGVAVGSGFAAMETMGYAFVQLLGTHGNLEPVAQLLAVRGVASLGGHAAWTGLACAALYGIVGARRRWFGWLRFGAVFAGVVTLHAQWDTSAEAGHNFVVVGLTSFLLLLATAWTLRRWRRA